jgi:hypothetical protein
MSDKDLIGKLLKASEAIHKTKGSANYIVTSTSVADFIQKTYNEQRAGFRKEKINKIFNERI